MQCDRDDRAPGLMPTLPAGWGSWPIIISRLNRQIWAGFRLGEAWARFLMRGIAGELAKRKVPTPRGGTTPDKAPNSSVVMPPPAEIPAMPVKGIVDPASVRTVWGSPKRVSPYGADHTTDDRARRPGNDKSSSGTKSCADGVSPRTGGRERRYSDSCDRGQQSPAQGRRKPRC